MCCLSISGLLQIMFLAGAINFRIQQHTEVPRYSYDTILSPCNCSQSIKGTVHIMWVKSSTEASSMNHIIPLIPGIRYYIPVCNDHCFEANV